LRNFHADTEQPSSRFGKKQKEEMDKARKLARDGARGIIRPSGGPAKPNGKRTARNPNNQQAKRYAAPGLHKIPHLPTHKQLAAAFFHIAASCCRIVSAFDGTSNLSARYVDMYEQP
jgi:hypothetical protein